MSLKKWQNGANKATITVDIKNLPTGHKPHHSGAGTHDNRPKRVRTRSAQRQEWAKDW